LGGVRDQLLLDARAADEKSLYVAIWFYIATIITVAMLYIVNHLSIPTSLTHSYPLFGGVQMRSCNGGTGIMR
ncbi:MAG: hypothetical protein HC783_16895, partial [Rhodobacteraceae bacterium]|nr:hypothetical protein [Paracoccaceae bacterium]